VEDSLLDNFFDFDEFRKTMLRCAGESSFIKKIIDDLLEPPPSSSGGIIPYFKEDKIVENIFKIAAEGRIVINAGGTWVGRRAEDADDDSALNYIKHRAADQINAMKAYQLALPTGGSDPVGPAPQLDSETFFPQIQPVPAPDRAKIPRSKSAAPSSGINLIRQFELWVLPSEKTINKTTLEFDGLNVSQIKQILQHIPSAYQAM
jgi:hypothetical protein